MKTVHQFHEEAEFLRESSGSTNIEKTLLKALRVFHLFNIPHYVCGGFAVQEHGYPRFTVDVDIIVPDVEFAMERLSLNGFRTNPGSKMTVTDRDTKVEVDLRTGETPGCVSEQPQIITLEKLISGKLSTYMGRGIERSQDFADVVKLAQVNNLSRDFGVAPEVRDEYQKIWDGLHQSQKPQ